MRDGLARAWAVAVEAWRQDKARPRVQRTRNELEFLPAAVEILETPPSPIGRAIALAIAAAVVTALAWSWFGSIDTVAVAQGKIIPSGHVKTIQPLEIGAIRNIHVEDGQRVDEGDALIELDPTEAGATREQLVRMLNASRLDVARANALLANGRAPLKAFRPPADADSALIAEARELLAAESAEFNEGLAGLDNEVAQRRAEHATIEARIARFDETIPILTQRVDAYAYLVEKEYGRKLALLELQEQLAGQRRDRTVEQRRLVEIKSGIQVLERKRAERIATIERTLRGRLAEALAKAHGQEQELRKADERHRLRILRAPVAGTVQQLAVHTIGAVVTPAEKLMIVVPDGSRLEVEAMLLNKDVGFVAPMQEAEIKLETFPFTKYGLISGRVETVSADAVADQTLGLVYPARISLAREDILIGDKRVRLSPGMAVTAEVKTGERRLLEFFLSPFLKYQDEALRER